MARRRKNNKSIVPLLIVIIISVLMLSGKGDLALPQGGNNTDMSESDSVYVHFIDVGQGSATLIQQGKTGILIDAGEREYGEVVVDYIEKVGVSSLEYVVASHPHSDHIGGLDEVLYAYPVDTVIMPELEESNTPTTRVYEDLLTAVFDKDINTEFISGEKGYSFGLNEDIDVEVLGPVEQSDNLNDMSVIVRVSAFDSEFMILGDAEKDELESVYSNPLNYNVSVITDAENAFKSDVIALGHHGSATSVYEPFLNAVDADVAVISCGKDNSYGHPHKEALEYVEDNGMTCYRTDETGDVVFKVTEDGYRVIK